MFRAQWPFSNSCSTPRQLFIFDYYFPRALPFPEHPAVGWLCNIHADKYSVTGDRVGKVTDLNFDDFLAEAMEVLLR